MIDILGFKRFGNLIIHLLGGETDLLVDTGVGVHSLARFLQVSRLRPDTEKPLTVVLTHCHFDHSGGAHQFAEVHSHQAEAKFVSEGSKFWTASWISPSEIVPKPKLWDAAEYCAKPANVRQMDEGQIFNLGDRSFSVLHLPGHSPGSVGLHDPDNGVLVTGDTLYQTDHGLIDWYPGSESQLMVHSLERILNLLNTGTVDIVLPGHNDVISSDMARCQALRHIEGNTVERRMRKCVSRQRAKLILGANVYVKLPPPCKEWIAN